ncbi:MAG TPA: sigma factor [Candidatus Dormibacteraeota bacterium]|jgi:RNA polymerase primary sigma factor|nr:sigma factor [Candidatus Dormibacteraeota bacterium]
MGVSRDHDERTPRPKLVDSDVETMRDLMRQMDATRPLREEELKQLLERAALGDRASQELLVAANLSLVIRLATERGDRGLSVPDLVQEGSIGLFEAVRSFAGRGESDFVSFAEERIADQMDQALATEAAAVRDAQLLVTAATDYEHTELVLRRELEREPTDSELAEKLEWTVERTRYVARVVADARRRYDEEMLEFIDPTAVDFDDDERVEFGS